MSAKATSVCAVRARGHTQAVTFGSMRGMRHEHVDMPEGVPPERRPPGKNNVQGQRDRLRSCVLLRGHEQIPAVGKREDLSGAQ